MPKLRQILFLLGMLAVLPGCGILPEVTHKPVVRNPFPQLRRVAVAPFFNLSDEPTVDGREFAIAYFNELQATPGFEVVPLAVVEQAIRQHGLVFNDSGADARRLAQLLKVDAVVVGAVTEFSPYYPPRCGLKVEWWSANPCFHAIPPGYGLPWGTTEEEFIPEPLVYEAEMALARAQLATQTPAYEREWSGQPAVESVPGVLPIPDETLPPGGSASGAGTSATGTTVVNRTTDRRDVRSAEYWPDARGFRPLGPASSCPDCEPSDQPVLEHARVYHGNDADFTEALSNYSYFRDDARYGGWQAFLTRSDDFIRFCCHLHIAQMLSARGGAGETQVVWRWSDDR